MNAAVPESKFESRLTLALLMAVQRNSAASQRQLAGELGVALGLANAYIRRCIHKGYVKVTHAPANRYFYYLTPHGFTEKARLSAEYLTQSFHFFRSARAQCEAVLEQANSAGFNRLGLVGISDLTEIMVLCAAEYPQTLVAIDDRDTSRSSLGGIPVVNGADAMGDVDAVVITAFEEAETLYRDQVRRLGASRVLAPKMLGLADLPVEPASD